MKRASVTLLFAKLMAIFMLRAEASTPHLPSEPWCDSQSHYLRLLPDHLSTGLVVLGHHEAPEYQKALQTILRVFDPEDVQIINPHEVSEQTPSDNILDPPIDDPLWLQDMWEVFWQGPYLGIVALPYTDDNGRKLVEYMGQVFENWFTNYELSKEPDHSGNFGGNIEALPGGILLTGENISDKITSWLLQNVTLKLIQVDVSWLDVGHVDEIISVVRDESKAAPCNFKILYASPQLGLELLRSEKISAQDAQKHSCLNSDQWDTKQCQTWLDQNNFYETKIQNALYKINLAIKSQLSCFDSNQLEPLPLVYTLISHDDGEGLATTIHPNSINLISNGRDLVLPDPKFDLFRKYISDSLGPMGYGIHYIDTDFLHSLQGNIHCMSKIIRKCES